jgi:dienelactone hydrolase
MDRIRTRISRLRPAAVKSLLILPLLLFAFALPLVADERPRRIMTIAAAYGPVRVEMPDVQRPTARPAIIVLSGSKGLGSPAYDEIARRFETAGLDVFLVHFLSAADLRVLEEAEDAASRKRYSAAQMPRWIASVRAVAAYLRADRPVGLLGISLGANVAAASAQGDDPPGALVLVDGGVGATSARLPPLLLVWGRDDRVFPPATARAFKQAVAARGGTVRLDMHTGAAHDFFIRPGSPQAASAQQAAAQFLVSQLVR